MTTWVLHNIEFIEQETSLFFSSKIIDRKQTLV